MGRKKVAEVQRDRGTDARRDGSKKQKTIKTNKKTGHTQPVFCDVIKINLTIEIKKLIIKSRTARERWYIVKNYSPFVRNTVKCF